MHSYNKPPITEAVIAVGFEKDDEGLDLSRYIVDFKQKYPNNIYTKNVDVKVNISDDVGVQAITDVNEQKGLRLSNFDQTEIMVIWPKFFLVSQLAPYSGWEALYERFTHDWKIWKRSVGYRKIANFGIRFINRIDVPINSLVTEESDYLNFHVSYPPKLGTLDTYGAQAIFPLNDIGCKLTINSGLAPSPLIRHMSLVLDLEIIRHIDVPQNDDDICHALELIRLRKNEVFEACVTDKARELFNS